MASPPHIPLIQDAIRTAFGCDSSHAGTSAVTESDGPGMVWRGEVETLELIGYPAAARCYAWDFDPGRTQCASIVLEMHPVYGPSSAVLLTLGESREFQANVVQCSQGDLSRLAIVYSPRSEE